MSTALTLTGRRPASAAAARPSSTSGSRSRRASLRNVSGRSVSSDTLMPTSRTTSSSVSWSGAGSQSSPSGGMQYAHRRLHRSVSDTRRSVAIRPKESGSIVPAYAGQQRSNGAHSVSRQRSGSQVLPGATAPCVSLAAVNHPVGPFGPQPEDKPPVADHRRPVVVPVRVVALHRAVQVDQLPHGRVVRVAGHLRQLRVPVHHHVGPEVTAGDMEADPRVTAHVAGLGPVVRGGDPDGLFLRVPGVVHVGQLWPPVFSEGDQYSLPLPGNQLSKPTLDHAARTIAGDPMFRTRAGSCSDTGRIR